MHTLRNYGLIAGILLISLPARSAQTRPAVRDLFEELRQSSTSDRAAREILRIVPNDSAARSYIAGRLPEMLGKLTVDRPWLNAVKLAGELKAVETIPVLKKALSLGKVGGPHLVTFATEMRLDDDVVAKALSQMGDAAIPVVRDLLTSQAPRDRRRAVLILRNMKTAAAEKLLRDQLQIENDPANRDLIESAVRSSN